LHLIAILAIASSDEMALKLLVIVLGRHSGTAPQLKSDFANGYEGFSRDRRIPAAPMPQFRLTQEDAEAVVDCLKSLR